MSSCLIYGAPADTDQTMLTLPPAASGRDLLTVATLDRAMPSSEGHLCRDYFHSNPDVLNESAGFPFIELASRT